MTNVESAKLNNIVRRSNSTFYWAMCLLPTEQRHAIFAVYAFCREVDDITDGIGRVVDKRIQLQNWREEVSNIFNEVPTHPLARKLVGPARRFKLSKDDFLLVIEGMEMDACDAVRIVDMDALYGYCDRVACAVGRLASRIFGLSSEQGNKLAQSLGYALQLTNILRDVYEDAQMNRVYLPQSLLCEHQIIAKEPTALITDPALPKVCAEITRVAEQQFDDAAAILKLCNRHRVRPARLMMESYRLILAALKRRGWRHLDEKISLKMPQKLWVILRYGLF